MAVHAAATVQKGELYSLKEVGITDVIYSVMPHLKGKVSLIKYDPQNDEDKNYQIQIETSFKKFEKISLFALKENGKWKAEEALVAELTKKIQTYLINKDNLNMLLLPSGAMINIESFKTGLSLENGLLKIEKKFIVVQRDGKFALLPASKMNTYTLFKVEKAKDLLIISDDHDQRRKDGREGFVFNLKQPVHLKKQDVQIDLLSEEEKKNLKLPEAGNYLILFRNKTDASKSKT